MTATTIANGIMTRRLAELRKLMAEHNVMAYIVPHQDAHNSEYISATDERIAFIANFDGSAGTCVVTDKSAFLWTDGRYFNQATQQLPAEWGLMKDRLPGTVKISDFLVQLGPGAAVGVDPLLTSVATYTDLSAKVTLKSIETNLVDAVWGSEQPVRSLAPVKELAMEFVGQSRTDKLRTIREEMVKEGATVTLVCALDEVAWTLNLRGSDIDYNPMFFAYLSIEAGSKTVLFIDSLKVSEDIQTSLTEDDIEIRPYDAFTAYVKILPDDATTKVWIDPDSANLAVYQAIPSKAGKVEKTLPIVLLKACKNKTEVDGARSCHIKDGAAETKWLCWLATEVMPNPSVWVHHTEVTLAEKLEDFRKEIKNFQGLSFGSISSFGANAAIIHYHARAASCAPADPTKIYLIDSGAQYLEGTTDVTRTVHFGTPTAREKDAFTRVLKGVIQLTKTKFPPGTTGPALDVIARHALWQNGLDYRHGTGHGVGSFLNVHEGPCGISPPLFSARSQALKTALKPGMILSNEPGYYEDGNFGIRIENLMTVVESDTTFVLNKEQKMLTFETLTVIPIQRQLIDVDLLTEEELRWLNEYHETVLEKVTPFLNEKEAEWLKIETAPISSEAPVKQSPAKRTRSSTGKQ